MIQALTLLLTLKVTEDSHYFSREEIYPAQATFPLRFISFLFYKSLWFIYIVLIFIVQYFEHWIF
jgi:hypothetical protein